MSYPNNVLSAWQMALMIVVPLTLLVGWVIVIFIADRAPRTTDVAAPVSVPAPVAASVSPPETAAPAQPDAPPVRRAA
jgi:hypothetical protein